MKRTMLFSKSDRARSESRRAEQRRLTGMMKALKAIHTATSPESMDPEHLERQIQHSWQRSFTAVCLCFQTEQKHPRISVSGGVFYRGL